MLQDRGLAPGTYVAQEMDVPPAVYKEGQEAQAIKQMKAMMDEAEQDPVLGPFVKLLTNPDTMGQAKQHLQAAQAAMQSMSQAPPVSEAAQRQ